MEAFLAHKPTARESDYFLVRGTRCTMETLFSKCHQVCSRSVSPQWPVGAPVFCVVIPRVKAGSIDWNNRRTWFCFDPDGRTVVKVKKITDRFIIFLVLWLYSPLWTLASLMILPQIFLSRAFFHHVSTFNNFTSFKTLSSHLNLSLLFFREP
jgi:hypothetical protein